MVVSRRVSYPCVVLCNSVKYSTVKYSSVQRIAVQCSTAPYSTLYVLPSVGLGRVG